MKGQYDIFLDNLPLEAMEEVQSFKKELDNKYLGRPQTPTVEMEFIFDWHNFMQSMRERYPEADIDARLTGLQYNVETWTITEIRFEYKQHYPERYVEKEEYTRMEVNNMLFDLVLCGVISDYTSVVCPFGLEYNDDIFSGRITVKRNE